MNVLYQPLPAHWVLAGWLLLVPALARALLAVRGGFLPQPAAQHAWLGGAVCVSLLWQLHFAGGGGIGLAMLGVGLYSVIFGRDRAMLGLMLALLIHTALAHGRWENLGVLGLMLAAWPAWVASLFLALLERRLPHNLFIFIIGNGMFGTLVATIATGLPMMLMALALAGPAAADNLSTTVGYLLLLAWGESIVSGMVFSALVVFLPEAVPTFVPDLYLPARGRRP